MFLSLFKTGAFEASGPGKPQMAKTMTTLYRNPNVVSCVFRALDQLSKMIVLRMVCGNISLPQSLMNLMVLEGKQSKELKASIKQLEELAIMRKNIDSYNLNDKFRMSMEKFITEPQEQPSFPVPLNLREEESAPLHYLLEQPPTQTVRQLLVQSSLITDQGSITREGFGFFLSDLATQVCMLMQSYTVVRGAELWEQILQLSLLDVDRAYVGSRWDMKLLKDLDSLKFVSLFEMDVQGKSQLLVRVNRVFRHFSFTQPDVDLSLKCDIIVETNFKIYAHIRAAKDRRNYDILRRILELFVHLEHRDTDFQELIVGTLTQESIRAAYAKRITSEQILQFFRKHTDPRRLEQAQQKSQILNKNDIVYNEKREKLKFLKIYSKQQRDIIPNNVIQEVRLWEQMQESRLVIDEQDDSDADQ